MQVRFDCGNEFRINELRKIVKPYPKLNEVLITPGGIHRLKGDEGQQKQVETMVISKENYDKLKAQVSVNKPKTEFNEKQKS